MQLDRVVIAVALALLCACQREAVTPEVIMISAEAGAGDASLVVAPTIANREEPDEPTVEAEVDVVPTPAPVATSGPCAGANAPAFDRGAAARALLSVSFQACKKPGGPTGSGHLKVTFAPSGVVSLATVDSGPFPGTAVGACIVGKFRTSTRIPAFCGAPVTVGKSFTIN